MKNEKGFTFIEVLIALALLGILTVAFLGGLSTASRAIFTADERATAESLARSQMEYVKNLDYAASYSALIPAEYAGYSAAIDTDELEVGLQKITVTVSHKGKPIITSGDCTLEGYKVDR